MSRRSPLRSWPLPLRLWVCVAGLSFVGCGSELEPRPSAPVGGAPSCVSCNLSQQQSPPNEDAGVSGESPGPRTPISERDCRFRAVGYGITEVMGSPDARRTADVCIDAMIAGEPFHFNVTGQDGRPCSGDSGGPLLLRATGQVVGVASLSIARAPGCTVDGATSVFIAIDGVRNFIDEALAEP